MTNILHLSDPHFGAEIPAVAEALRRLYTQQGITSIILSGDITQRARASQFKAARSFIDSLAPKQLIHLPGNHDISLFNPWSRLINPYGVYHTFFSDVFDELGVSVHSLPNAYCIAVRTTRRYRHVHGEISPAQIERIAHLLHNLPAGGLNLVICHQPIYVIEAEEEENLLRGGASALALWRRAGADAILGGHIHQPYITLIPDEAQPQKGNPMWAIQAGTAVSERLRDGAPNSVNIIRTLTDSPPLRAGLLCNPLALNNPTWQAERWNFDSARDAFTLDAAYWIK